MQIRLFGVANDSIVDGPGLRYSVYVQGCSHKCPGCHNPGSWDFDGGQITTVDAIIKDILSNKLVNDVTLSGGDPFDQVAPVAALARELKKRGYGIWTYSGYTFEQLQERAKVEKDVQVILDCSDVLVDGPFLQDKKSLELKWKGSSNQRVIDMNKTSESGHIVLFEEKQEIDSIPPNW